MSTVYIMGARPAGIAMRARRCPSANGEFIIHRRRYNFADFGRLSNTDDSVAMKFFCRRGHRKLKRGPTYGLASELEASSIDEWNINKDGKPSLPHADGIASLDSTVSLAELISATSTGSSIHSNSEFVEGNDNTNIAPPILYSYSQGPPSPSRSLGTGSWSVKSFGESPKRRTKIRASAPFEEFEGAVEIVSGEDSEVAVTLDNTVNLPRTDLSLQNDETKRGRTMLPPPQPAEAFHRDSSFFLRVADLPMDETAFKQKDETASSSGGSSSLANFHFSAVDPPPFCEPDPLESWVALDNGCDGVREQATPIAPIAVSALCRAAMDTSINKNMWEADYKTAKLIHDAEQPQHDKYSPRWQQAVWLADNEKVILPENCTKQELDHVLVWSGQFQHGLYGSHLPAVRAASIMDIPPTELKDLLVDSNRVKEYNKLSLGRSDILVLQNKMEDGLFGGITKIMNTQSKLPMIKKSLQFTSLMHVRALPDDSGYILATRAVSGEQRLRAFRNNDEHDVLKSEILMGVTIIKRLCCEGNPENKNRCLMITVNHISSPMVPMMIAKRIGLKSAANFFYDLRKSHGTSHN